MQKKKIMTGFLLGLISLFAISIVACKSEHKHIYMDTIIAPTCTEQGYTKYVCECGNYYIDTYIDVLGHDFTNYISDNNATYINDGTKTAHCNHTGCKQTDTIIDTGTKLISGILFNTLYADGTEIFGKVSNDTETFSFINEITVKGDANYTVSLDIYGIQQVATKTIALELGDNTVYITEIVNNEPINVYTVTVRRKPMYTVTFETHGGTVIPNQVIEEDGYITTYSQSPLLLGYSFIGWDYDFSKPIEKNMTVTAEFEIEKEMSNFDCSSTDTTCIITGLKDKTVTEIVIPYYVTAIDSSAFVDCNNLTSIIVDENNISYKDIDGNLYTKDETTLIQYAIGKTATKFVIPDNVTSIGSSAFEYCYHLTSIVIPYNLTSIGGIAFKYCYKLVEIYNKSSLDIVTGSESLGYIGYYAKNIYTPTKGASKLSTDQNGYVVYDENNKISLISYTGTESDLILPSGITTINRYAFYNYDNLKSITIENNITYIDYFAFENCDNLTTVIIGDNVTRIASYSFYHCHNLTNVTIGNGVTSIGSCAFKYCYNLTNIVLGKNVSSIGSEAFSCSNLKHIVIPNSVTSIGSYAFYYCYELTAITFENPSGWKWYNDLYSSSGTIQSSKLSTPSIAATYLTSTYSRYSWRRN